MKIILLDRDGTVIRDPEDERVDTEEKIELFPDSIEALQLLKDNGFGVIVITNQAGIAEGKITVQDFERIHAKALEMLSPSGVEVIRTYVCPHAPEDQCECRKPKPKMILDALKEYGLSASEMYMVGDRISDIEAGSAAGTKTILVETANVAQTAPQATYTASNLLEAVQYVITH